MTWFTEEKDWDAIVGSAPLIAGKFQPYSESQWQLPQIPAGNLELCRLRLAQLHGNQSEFAKENTELPEGKKANLENWHSDPSFSAAEQACLAFTEVYAMDLTAITDEHAEAVKAHYGDAGLVALVQALGLFYGLTRVSMLWDLQ